VEQGDLRSCAPIADLALSSSKGAGQPSRKSNVLQRDAHDSLKPPPVQANDQRDRGL